MERTTLVFDGLGGGPENVRRAEFLRDEDGPCQSPDSLRYDSESDHWQFPTGAVSWSDGVQSNDSQTVSVPRENVYFVSYERRTPTVATTDTTDSDADIAYESLPGEYTSVSQNDNDLLEPPRFDAESGHWDVVFSPTDVREDDQRLVFEKRIPRERVCYVRGAAETTSN